MKSRLQLHLLTILFIIQSVITLHAQFNAPRFQRFTYAEGLPNGEVHHIREDTEGFIWMATAQGICRFDGYKFQLLTGQNPSQTLALSHDRPIFFAWDTYKRWWIGSDWAGVRLFDKSKQDIRLFGDTERYATLGIKNATDTLSNGTILSVFSDNTTQKVWIGTYSKGLNVFDIEQNHLDKSGIYASSLFKNSSILKIDKDKQGNIWVIATNKGLCYFDCRTQEWSIAVNQPDIAHFSINTEGVIWFTTKNKLFQYNPLSKEKPIQIPLKGLTSEISFTRVHCDKLGRIWLGTTNGLGLISYKNAPIQFFKNEPKNPYSLLSDFIQEVFEDSKGNIWVGCAGDGVCRIANTYSKIKTFDNPYPTQQIEDVAVAPDATLFAVTKTHFLISLPPYNQTNFITAQKLLPCADALFYKLTISETGHIYLGTSCGIGEYSPKTKQFQFVIPPTPSFQGGIKHLKIWGDTLLSFGLTAVDGLNLFHLKTKTSQRFDSKNLYYNTTFTHSIIRDKNGIFWANSFSGLLRIGTSLQASDTIRFVMNFVKGDYIQDANAGEAVLEIGDNVWWGREDGGGLNVLSEKDSTFRYFNNEHGLFNSSITTLLADKTGHLWAGSYFGISRIKIPDDFHTAKTLFSQNYTLSDGLPHNTVNCTAITPNGEHLFVGTAGGMSLFSLKQLTDTFTPKIVFTNFQLLGKSIVPNDSSHILTQDINETKTITLNHNQAFFTLELSGLDFASAAQMRYAYRLVGIHTDWIDNGFQNTLAFNNIAPGDYVLEVKTQGTNGVWSAIKTLEIHVLPPFWRRAWFIALCIALFLLGVYKLYTFRINQLKRVHIVQNSIAADLHDDIGSSLSHIEILSFLSQNQLKPEGSGEKAKELMVKITEEVKKTNESLHQLVWTMHAENDGFEPTMTKLNRMAIEILEPQDIRLSFDLPQHAIPSFQFGRERQRDLIMVYKEAITNISKHAQATAVHIVIDIKKEVLTMLTIDISDNGIGCQTKVQTSSFGGNGLKNMNQRMVKHGGTCVVSPRENEKGTFVSIRLPIYPPN